MSQSAQQGRKCSSLTPGHQVVKSSMKNWWICWARCLQGHVCRQTADDLHDGGSTGLRQDNDVRQNCESAQETGQNPLLVACDVYRPAAETAQVVGDQLGVPVFSVEGSSDPVDIARKAADHAVSKLYDLVIIDTAGRLHIDDELMEELKNIKNAVRPHEILLVVDSMTGQDAVNVAEAFSNKLGIDGIVLTKLDGDTRGGAALSVKAVTGKPVKFAAAGEKLSDIEPFYPDRMASRILGMGDVLSLIEKAQEAFDEKKAIEAEKKLRTQQFTFDDFLEQMQQLKNMGPLNQVLGMLPGMNNKVLRNMDVDEKACSHGSHHQVHDAQRKEKPVIINGSRRKRIATGSGTSIQEVNSLLRQFEEIRKIMKMMSGAGKKGGRGFGKFRMPFKYNPGNTRGGDINGSQDQVKEDQLQESALQGSRC